MRIVSLTQTGGRWFSRFRRQPLATLADPPAKRLGQELLQESRRHFARRKRLVLLALVILTSVMMRFLLPLQVGAAPSLQRAAQVAPGAAPSAANSTTPDAAPFCGTPAAVFAHFHLSTTLVPGTGLLSQLPAPVAGGTATNPPVTYDPAQGRLCASSASALSALFLPSQSAGTGARTNAPAIDIDPVQWALDALQAVEEKLVQSIDDWLSQQIHSLGFVTNTNANLSYQNPVIQKLNAWLVAGIGGMLALVFMVAGHNYMFRAYRHGWSEFAPKIIICAVLASFSLTLLGMAIETINAIITDFQPALTVCNAAGSNCTAFSFPPQVPNNPIGIDGIVFLIELIAILFLLLQMLVRLAILDLLLALAPLGIMCYALPQSRPWGRAWALAFVSALIVQPLQIFAVGIGAALIGTLGDTGNLIGALIGLGVMYVAWRIPGMLLSNSLRAMSTVTRDTFSAIGAAADTVGEALSSGEETAALAA